MRDPAPDRARFISLFSELFQLQGVAQKPAAASLQQVQKIAFQIDDIEFRAMHFPLPEPNLLIHCHLGELGLQRSRVLRHAMLVNGAIAGSCSAMFAIDRSCNQLVYSIPENLHEVTAQTLLDGMAEIATVAKTWREQGLIQQPEKRHE